MIGKNYDVLLRLIVIGDSNVGKSSLVRRYSQGAFDGMTSTTVGIDYSNKRMERDGKVYKIQFWDTAGQEVYNSLAKITIRDSQGIVLVYDASKKETFQALKSRWSKLVDEYASKTAFKIVVANKIDLTSEREVSTQEGKAFADSLGVSYYETSAMIDHNVNEMFGRLLDNIIENSSFENELETEGTRPVIRLQDNEEVAGCRSCTRSQSRFCC